MKNNFLVDILLYNPMKKYGRNHVISIFDNDYYTYGYYEKLVKQLSDNLSKIGVKDEAVIILMDDSPICVGCFLSLINVGAKPLIVSPKTLPDVLNKIMQIAESRLIICSVDSQEKACEASRNSIVINKNGQFCDDIILSGVPFLLNEEVCYLALTSGSSGIPKIVMHSSSEMFSAIENYAINTLGISNNDVLLSIPKISFTYGLANSLFFSFYTGAKAIICEGTMTNEMIINNIIQNGVTFFFGVPTIYEKLVRDENIDMNYLALVHYFVSAGEYLASDLVDKWYERTQKYIIDSVGCSETGSAYLVNFNSKNKKGCAGVPVKGYKLSFASGDENRGTLIVEGPSNAMGYLNNFSETQKKFVNKSICTGDWFFKDEDGFYWFLGRDDDMIKRNGRWVSLNEISDCVKKSGYVDNAAAFQLNNQIYLVVESAQETFDMMVLEDIIFSSLEHYKKPDKMLLDTIPINANGKIDNKRLREKYERQ